MTDDLIARIHAKCVTRMWADSCDDKSRLVLEQACDALRDLRGEVKALRARLTSQARVLEQAEANNERLYDLAFGNQKGGAA